MRPGSELLASIQEDIVKMALAFQFDIQSCFPIMVYFLISFAYTWVFHFGIVRKDLAIEEPNGRLHYLVGLPGPTIAALVTASLFGSLDQLGRSLFSGRIVLHWWLLAIFIMPATYLTAIGIHSWRTGERPKRLFHRPKMGWPGLLLAQLYVVFSEEVGWRGFALPSLIGIMGSIGGTLVLGLAWAAWHVPMFYVPSSHQKGAFWGYAYSLMMWSIIMTSIVGGSDGNILPAMAFHASANISYFTMDISAEADRISNVLLGLIGLLLALIAL